MSEPTLQDWESGRTAMDSQKMFVLWVVKAGICQRHSDFQAHFGTEFDVLDLAHELIGAKCLQKSPEGEYELTELGDEILLDFEDSPAGTQWGRITSLGPFAIRLFTRFTGENARGCFDAWVGPDESLIALACHVSGPDGRSLSLATGLRILFSVIKERHGASVSTSTILDNIKDELQFLGSDSCTVRCVIARFTRDPKTLSIASKAAVAKRWADGNVDRTLAFASRIFPATDSGSTSSDSDEYELQNSSELVLTAPPAANGAENASETLGNRLIRRLPKFGESRPLFAHVKQAYERHVERTSSHKEDTLIASVRLATPGDRLILNALKKENPLQPYHRLFWKLYNKAVKSISPDKEVTEEDVFQDWWLHMIERLPQWQGRGLLTWVKVATVNYLVTLKRDWARIEVGTPAKPNRLEDHEPEAPDDEPSMLKEAMERLPKAISDLPEEDQELIRLKYFDELSIEEILAQLGLTVDQVKKRLQRARRRLYDLLARLDEDRV